ncbi:hypothetical protein Goshw_013329 [Gossypium schwendimanii]|uniref:RNase H type-1 domain-containing protein n=1 Tax=Gossypium schwendimanii TaxID=34291 RepID=A0A7J9KS32_GOSSC|nr:hypothetical protein [Gossypium schwendimanii]
MGACVYPVINIRDPTTAAVVACLQAVTFIEEMGFRDIMVEGDSLTVIKKLNNQEYDRSVICNILKEIKLKAAKFRNLSFRFVPRSANKVAHELVIWGREWPLWMPTHNSALNFFPFIINLTALEWTEAAFGCVGFQHSEGFLLHWTALS